MRIDEFKKSTGKQDCGERWSKVTPAVFLVEMMSVFQKKEQVPPLLQTAGGSSNRSTRE